MPPVAMKDCDGKVGDRAGGEAVQRLADPPGERRFYLRLHSGGHRRKLATTL
jgi:hypothetical protein